LYPTYSEAPGGGGAPVPPTPQATPMGEGRDTM